MNDDSKYSFESPYYYGNDTNKCNAFVDDVLSGSGRSPRRRGGLGGPIAAGDWANPKNKIPNFPQVSVPQPGDIVAIAHNYPGGASGHVAIVEVPGVSTIGAVKVVVTEPAGLGIRQPRRKGRLSIGDVLVETKRWFRLKLVKAIVLLSSVLVMGYFLYPKIIIQLFGNNIPNTWNEELFKLNHAQLIQLLGNPDEDLSAKDYQTWLRYESWGMHQLRIGFRKCCNESTMPEDIHVIMYLNGRYKPIKMTEIDRK